MRDIHFPGGNARASLKHEIISAGAYSAANHFPGGNARASLKPFLADRSVYEPAHFPGGNARASLKRDVLDALVIPGRRNTSQAETPGPH